MESTYPELALCGSEGTVSLRVKTRRDFLCWQVRAGEPDLWLWLGDNVYNDGTDMDFKRRRSAKDLFLNCQIVIDRAFSFTPLGKLPFLCS